MDKQHEFTITGQGLNERIQVGPTETLRDVLDRSLAGRQGGERQQAPRRVRISYELPESSWNKPFSELLMTNGVIELTS